MDIKEIISHEKTRKSIYRTLSRAYQLPDEKLPGLAETLDKNLRIVDPSETSHKQLLQEALDTEKLRELVIEFTRLFIGPYSPPAPPYGSIYLETEHRIMGDSTLDAESRYAGFGIQVAGNFRDVPDHIAAEFEFMFFLVHREVEFLLAGENDRVIETILEQKKFITDHLNAWIPHFSDRVTQHADISFYKNLASLTRRYIAWDAAYLNQVRLPEYQNVKR